MAVKTNLRSFFNKPKVKGEVNTMKSMTRPNQVMSLRTLVTRFINGQPIPPVGVDELLYSEDQEDLRFLDVSERYRLIQAAKVQYGDAEKAIVVYEKEQEAKKEALRLEAYKNKVIGEFIQSKKDDE